MAGDHPGGPKDVRRVVATNAALSLVDLLRHKHGPLMSTQSGGCCDGSAPMCYPRGDFLVGDYDRLLGEIGGQPFYISGPQFEYWQHTQLIIDVVPGRGGMFSLEGPERAALPDPFAAVHGRGMGRAGAGRLTLRDRAAAGANFPR